jgi:hypothetical protein
MSWKVAPCHAMKVGPTWSFDTVVTITGPHGVKGRSNCAVGTVACIAQGILIRERRARFALSEAASSAPASTSDWVGADRRAEQRENFDRSHLPGRCHYIPRCSCHSDFDSHFPRKKTFAVAMTGRRLIAKRSTRGGFPRSRVAGKGKLMLVRNLEPENVGPSLSEGKDLLSSTARCAS